MTPERITEATEKNCVKCGLWNGYDCRCSYAGYPLEQAEAAQEAMKGEGEK